LSLTNRRRSELEARQPAPPRFTSPPPANKKYRYFRFLPFSLIAVHAPVLTKRRAATAGDFSGEIPKNVNNRI
jgi:hypothetical protein